MLLVENQQEGHYPAQLEQESWQPSQTTLKNEDLKPLLLYHGNEYLPDKIHTYMHIQSELYRKQHPSKIPKNSFRGVVPEELNYEILPFLFKATQQTWRAK